MCNQKALKFDVKHQPDPDAEETHLIRLEPGHQFEMALQDLAGFDRIWLIWWFHRNSTWRPRTLPPRGPAHRRGVFATRAPHRPNPIGLTCVSLLEVNGLELTVGPLDLVDGTPILDIKPYLTTVDCFPGSSLGWLDEVEVAMAEPPKYSVEISPRVRAQVDWLEREHGVRIIDRVTEVLARDPSPHRTRRILDLKDGRFRMACGPWRVYFSVVGSTVTLLSIAKGYSDSALAGEYANDIQHGIAQREFAAIWPAES